MKLGDLKQLIKEVKKELIKESGFSRVRQIMLGQVPSVDTIAILTAENPDAQPLTPAENNALMRDLKASLEAMRIGYTDIGGSFGSPEKSVFIMNISRDDTTILGKKFGQEAVIWAQKMRKEEGEPFFRFEYIEGYETVQTRDVSMGGTAVQSLDDYYSEKEGRKFVIPFFDDAHEHSSPSDGGRRVSFGAEEIPDDEEAHRLAENINKRNRLLFQKKRTNKSKWHHRNVMREEIKKLQKIISK